MEQPSPATRTWELVGRGSTVSSVLRALRDGQGSVLVGEAGVGKTRLAREVRDRAEGGAWSVLPIVASRSAESIPLGALAPHLPVPGERTLELGETLRLAGDTLRAAATDRLLLSVDDAHYLDDATATVVHQLALREDVAVLATVRLGESCPDPVRALWKDGHARRVDLKPLSPEETEALLESALGGPVDGRTAQAVWNSSEGNPLYLREMVEGALDAGILAERGGLWRLLDPEAAVSPRLVDLVEARLDRLDEVDRDVLAVLAVADELPVAVLETMGLGDRLEPLERAGLIETQQDRRRCSARLAHPLHRQVIDHQLTTLRRQTIARDLADLLAALGARRRDDVLRLALWRLDGGGDTDPAVLTEAARRVAVLHEDRLAVRLSQAALDVGDGFEARFINGAALGRLGQAAEAEAVLAAADLEGVADEDKAILTIARTDNLCWALGDAAAAIDVIAEVRSGVRDAAADAELGVNAAVYAFMSGNPGGAIAALEPVVDSAPDRVAVTAAMSLAPSLAVTGRGGDGVKVVERALAIRATLDDPERLTEEPMLHMSHGFALVAAGRLEEAVAATRTGYDEAVAAHDRPSEAWCAMILSLATRLCGQIAASVRWGVEGEDKFTEVGLPGLARVCAAGRMFGQALLGQVDAAAEARQAITAVVPGFATLEPETMRALAWERAMVGDTQTAVDHLTGAASQAASMGARFLEANALHDLVRLGRATDVVDRLDEVAANQQSDVVAAMAAHGRAAAGDDPDALETVSEVLKGLDQVLLAAEAAAQAAAMFRSSSQSRLARRCARRAAALAESADGVRTPALVLAGAAGRLTRREREVSSLSATGLTNRQVAEELGVSIRTVETHLHRSYDKLGTDRDGLPAALEELSDDD